MRYLVYTIIALVGYSFVPPLMRLATGEIPSPVAAFGASSIFTVTALAVALVTHEPIAKPLTGSHGKYVLIAGIFLAVSILSFFHSLSLGPVSIIVPIFGLFLVMSSVIGVYVLDETLSSRQVLGIGLAITSIAVLSTS